MSQELHITATSKEEKYRELLPQIKSLVEGETDMIANMANICSALKYSMNFFWVGFYLIKNNAMPDGRQELVLGPFQGTIACTRIQKGKGVCGKSWELNDVIIVEDVDQFPGHIACSSLSKSEIVLPVYNSNKEIIGVLDVDSDEYSSFDRTDEFWLKQIVELIK
jgi:L-methionine (R)-S-oxide reductase